MANKQFYRFVPTKGWPLYWIFLVYLVVGYFYPAVGIVAIVCMVAPVAIAIYRGRWWCGNACPRGNAFDRLLAKYSPHRPIPKFVRSFGFRLFVVLLVFSVFAVQMYSAWGDVNAMGRAFWFVILVTTIVGVVLAFIYAPRTWCTFCPMGTLSSWLSPRKAPLPKWFTNIHVADTCQMKCKSCARVCPMQLTPYDSRGSETGFLHPDCVKCGRCVAACPSKIMELKK